MNIQGVKPRVTPAAGILRNFRNQLNVQVKRQVQNVKVEVKRLVNYKA